MELGGGRKRGKQDAALNGNGGLKKSRQEMGSFQTGIGSKSKPCTKFFSTSGCPFGQGCHFLHYVPGGYKAVSQMLNLTDNPAPLPLPARNVRAPPSFPDGSSPPAVKSRLCNKYNTAESCKFGHKCHFAHSEWELGKPNIQPYEDPRSRGQMQSRMGRQTEHPPQAYGTAASFGASSTAKISIDASLAGPIIGKSGANSKQICQVTGAKLSIREHETDPSLKNIELEGTFDQINQASGMVRELIANVRRASGRPMRNPPAYGSGHGATRGLGHGNNFKSKLCDNFMKGNCNFGDRCHFAHGAEQLRKSGV